MAKTSMPLTILSSVVGLVTMGGIAYAAYKFVINPTEHPTPEDICRYLEKAKLATNCKGDTSPKYNGVERYWKERWEFSVGNEKGAIEQFANDDDKDAAWKEKLSTDKVSSDLNEIQGHSRSGPMYQPTELRFMVDAPRTMLLFPKEQTEKVEGEDHRLLERTLATLFKDTKVRVVFWLEGK